MCCFDAATRALPNYYDKWFTEDMDKNLADNGIELHFGELAREYKGTEKVEAVVTDNGEYPVDLVINAIGFLPNNELGKDHLELFANGAYQWTAINGQAMQMFTQSVTVQRCTQMLCNKQRISH